MGDINIHFDILYMKCINEMGDISGDIYNVMRFRAVSRPKYNVPCSTRHYVIIIPVKISYLHVTTKQRKNTGFVSFYRSPPCQ